MYSKPGSNQLSSKQHGDLVDVPEDKKFIGFDGYKHAMDSLKKGDIAIFTTPLAFRWVHFKYAIEKGLNVFMEKPLTADGPTSRRMLEYAEQATAKNLKVGVGLMSRHSRALQELQKRIQDGEIGELNLLRGYRMAGPLASAFSEKWPGKPSDCRQFHAFTVSRASGGCFSDFYIHHIGHLCMMKNAWPVKAQALGGRHYRHNPDGVLYVDQNFDSYAVEYTFEDGAKMYMDGRCMIGAEAIYSSHVQGSKGMAIVSKNGDCGMPSSTYKTQSPRRDSLIWTSKVDKKPLPTKRMERSDAPSATISRIMKSNVASKPAKRLPGPGCHTGRKSVSMRATASMNLRRRDKLTLTSAAPVLADASEYPSRAGPQNEAGVLIPAGGSADSASAALQVLGRPEIRTLPAGRSC
jgi:predicted dehydrogenase